MQRRQAILVFVLALVAGMLAVAIAAPDEETSESAPSPAPSADRGVGNVRVAFDAAKPQTTSVPLGSQVQLEVEVPAAGLVEVRGQGLTGAAQPGTPARFDVLASDAGRFEVRYVPVEGGPRRAGTLVVE